ncbi:MAG: hypothetical protein IPN29_11070 [Saprospiraceae bacterium]|nr:hypothetical protein [Saprospiraceae bacterium]
MLTTSMVGLRLELEELTLQQSKELDDIEHLEKMNVSSVLQTILGRKEDQLDKERQEYLAVAMKIKEIKKTIELTEYEARILEEKVQNQVQLKQQLDILKQKREVEILTVDDQARPALQNTIQKIDDCSRTIAELNEAYLAGHQALLAVEQVQAYLQEAVKWGEWDMYGGNRGNDYRKHDAIDQATNATYMANQKLMVFKKELIDVGLNEEEIHLEIAKFSRFSDIFFDNLVTDWIAQKKIKSVIAAVTGEKEKIGNLMQHVTTTLSKVKADKVELEVLKDSIIVGS